MIRMAILTLPAHFDGEHILLDEPYALEPDTRLLVTVLPKPTIDGEREDWLRFSAWGLATAYAEDEVEYSPDLIKETNPEYEGG
jgi:hypothetical protein